MSRAANKSERWRRLERMLSRASSAIPISTIVAELKVHRSTIYRDLEELSLAGLPIFWQERGKVAILSEKYLQPLQLNIYEALSLFIAIRLLTRTTNEFNPHVQSALRKIADVIPDPVSSHIKTSALFLNTIPQNKRYVQNLEYLMRAWINQRRIKMSYQSTWAQEPKERLFDVYFIEPIETWNTVYTLGWDHLHDEMRVFKVKRIQDIEILDDNFTFKGSFDSFAHWGNSWGFVFQETSPDIQVKIKFSERAAFLVRETVWHQTQEVIDLEEGGCLFSVRVNTSLFKIVFGIRSWILSWGADAEVLEPMELRNTIRTEVERLHSLYS